MIKPKVLIFSGYGLNCEEETKFSFEQAGGEADIVHINDLIKTKSLLKKYQIIAFPGGFSYGDDTGSGNAYASKLRNTLWEEIVSFVEHDTLTIGICNGFQIIVNLGLLPALDNNYGERSTALLPNSNARYTVRWVDVKVINKSPWLAGIKNLSLPIAHGEGRFFVKAKTLKRLKKQKQIALRYVKGEICKYQNLKPNPNGSLFYIAGITDPSGRILGMMPHPERAISFTQLPNWTYLKEKYVRVGKKIPNTGPGLQIFKNAVNYFK